MQPEDGWRPGPLIGEGGCGRVCRVEAEGGTDCVIKVFDEAAISLPLLEKMTRRLKTGGWPAGVMKVMFCDFEAEPPYWITPLVAEDGGEDEPVARNLQNRLGEYPGAESWRLVGSLARALAGMHERQVAHGNLKPGNVFFDNDGEVLLSDWALGNMPGVKHAAFTDAELYQPPEQLRLPQGYLEDAGYRWDVFAFGVLAYRVVTGCFPRCNRTFSLVAPAPGEMRKEGIKADLPKVAGNLETQPEVTWPDEAGSPLEAGWRGWIDRCLQLDPAKRPFSMVEVASGFAGLETQAKLDVERDGLLDKRRGAERRIRKSWVFAGIATAAAIVLGALWQQADSELLKERGGRSDDARVLKAAEDTALAAKADAEAKLAESRQALKYERELSVARLEASRWIGDRLFFWAMEKGHRRLPPLDGREQRLKRLERYFEDFLASSAAVGELTDERARVRLQLAEISLAAGDAPAAGKRLGEALEAWKSLPMDAETKFRMATNSLLLALLRQSTADPAAELSFAEARRALGDVPQSEVDADRLNQLLAILDFNEAKLLAARGEDAKAMEQLLRATQTLNRISDQRPDAAILRSELAACYLSSATILEGMGNLGDAREVRSLASVELVKLLKNKPDDFALRLELAGCYGAMAESAVLSGDIVGAESISKEAMKLLDRLVIEQPDNAEAVSRKAFQLGLRAGIQRDRGLSAEALKDYEEGIRMLEAIHASVPDNATASFRLAQLWWQKGRMSGIAGRRDEEIALLRKARDLLGKLEAAPPSTGPRPEQLQSAAAYLLGDLGHSLQLANRKPEAVRAFSDAVALWESLARSRPQSEEYSGCLAWSRQRLADLK